MLLLLQRLTELGLLWHCQYMLDQRIFHLLTTFADRTNNWSDYGGMDVYVNQIANSTNHDLFYTNANVIVRISLLPSKVLVSNKTYRQLTRIIFKHSLVVTKMSLPSWPGNLLMSPDAEEALGKSN